MQISELLVLAENKLQSLLEKKQVAFNIGDLEQYQSYDIEIEQTQATVNKLRQL